MNFSDLEPWILTSLNCAQVSELTPWTEAELYAYAEEALHDIGGKFLLIAEYDASTNLVPGQGTYPLDPLHIATIYAAADGETLQPTTVAEMEALDDAWQAAANNTPTRWIGNVLGLAKLAVYPPPAVPGFLGLLFQKHPPDLTPQVPSVMMPAPVGDYLSMRLLEHARLRQGEMEMPDVAQALEGLAAVYEQALEAYYGRGAV